MSRLQRAERRGAKKPPDTRPFIRDSRRPFEGPVEKATINEIFKEVHRILKPGGRFIMDIPSKKR